MESINDFVSNYDQNKAKALSGRYITNDTILPLLKVLPNAFKFEIIGRSEQNRPIYSIKIGAGKTKILIWSQMHGNESTCTKALFDVFNVLTTAPFNTILQECSLFIIPILNPDGAAAYTRHNSNQVDINRDAVDLSQAESKVLRTVFDAFKPDYGFNMHDQRTLFNVGQNNVPATVSFLSPAQDKALTLTSNRLRAMSVIHQMNALLQNYIPGQVGRFDDAFNINCVGDYFQTQGTSTILFEAGHYQNDYCREKSRKFIALATLQALLCISANSVNENDHENYFQIPENNTLFFDVLIKNALISNDSKESVYDIGISYEEILKDEEVLFVPKIKSIGDLSSYFGHKIINAEKKILKEVNGSKVEINAEFYDIFIGGVKFSLFLNNNLA
ncbi:MAG: M14 family zinc carboxypeptidase [Flavobacteriaceae bacterium]